MALVDSLSAPSTKSELDFFTVPPTQVVVKKGYWDEINTTNPVTNEGPYEFRIPSDPNMIQLSKNYIYMQLKITKTDGSALAATDAAVAPINMIGKTFFKQAKLFLNGRLVYDSGDKYMYRAYFETDLNYGHDAKSTHLQSAMYTMEAPKFDDVDSPAFKERAEYFKDRAVVELTAPLHIDLFMQDRYLLKNTELRLELTRNNNDFVLQSAAASKDVQMEVTQMKLYMRKVEVLDSIGLALEQTMLKTTAKYPIRRVSMMNLHIPSSAQSTPLNTLFTGQLPRRMILACVDGDAYRGTITKSPFNFKCYSINEVKVVCGGQTFPGHPLKIDFSKGKYIRAYDQLFESLNIARDNKGNLISRKNFKYGQCYFAFDLTPDEDDSGHWGLIKEGTTSIELSFSDRIPDSGVEVIIYAEFDNLIMIDKNRHVFHDFNA